LIVAIGPDGTVLPLQNSADTPAGLAFRRGVLTNVLNPKVALFFLALLPQFIDSGSPTKVGAFLVLGLTFVATGTVWCLFLAVAASQSSGSILWNHGRKSATARRTEPAVASRSRFSIGKRRNVSDMSWQKWRKLGFASKKSQASRSKGEAL
jgi:hypothetical protein